MRAVAVEYHAPARFDDTIEVFVRVSPDRPHERDLRARRLPASTDDALMVTAHQTVVLVDLDARKACPIPESYRAAVRAFEGEDLEE